MKKSLVVFAALILSAVGASAQTAPQATVNYLFSQGGHPIIIITDGVTLQEQSIRLGVAKDGTYVYANYTLCVTVKGQPVLNGTAEMNKTAIFGGYCDYSVMAAPTDDLSKVSTICTVRTGEDITYFGMDGLSGLSQHSEKVEGKCNVPGKTWGGFSASHTGSVITRMPLTAQTGHFITAGWMNGKFTFLAVDTGDSITSLNFDAFKITGTGNMTFTLANGEKVAQATATTSFCYIGTFCSTIDVSDTPAGSMSLLGMSFLRAFSSVTFNTQDETLDLVVREK